MNRRQQFREGLITNNPVLVQQIGMCATITSNAVTEATATSIAVVKSILG